MGRKDEITGGGAVPPPDAPIEKSEPIRPDAQAEFLNRARQNEQTLKPFNPQRRSPPPLAPVAAVPSPTAGPALAPAPDLAARIADVFDEPPIAAAPPPTADELQVDQYEDSIPALTDEDRKRMPAASNSESPSRGILPNLIPPTGDKFDGIPRGGFGDAAFAEYTPLNGYELLQLVKAEAKALLARCENDLRFSMAITYPRVRLRVSVEVEGAAEDKDNDFRIDRVRIPKGGEAGSTPLDVARALGAEDMVFVLSRIRQEFDEEGRSDEPPDALRDAVGLDKPRKTMLVVGGRHMFVDILPGSTGAQ
jgi:hypothetical protein